MKRLLTILFLLSSFIAGAQVYTPQTAAGYGYKRVRVDTTLHIPSVCGVPTLRDTTIKHAAIAFDSCGHKFYFYDPKTLSWDTIKGGITQAQLDDTAFAIRNDIPNIVITKLTTDSIPEGNFNLYYTTDRVRSSLYGQFPIMYDNTTGVISIDTSTALTGVATKADLLHIDTAVIDVTGRISGDSSIIDIVKNGGATNHIYFVQTPESDPTVSAYIKTITSAFFAHGETAYSWGNHASAGYLTSFTESDPIWSGVSGNYRTFTQNNLLYAPLSHFHDASDIISGILPIIHGGLGLATIGTTGQSIRVATGGTTLEYYTPAAGNSGTVTSIATTSPITGGTITTTGTIGFDTTNHHTKQYYDGIYGSLSQQNTNTTNIATNTSNILLKVNISDTSAMQANEIRSGSIAWPGTIYSTPTLGVVSSHNITYSPSLASQSAYTLFGRGSGTGTPSFLSSIDSNWIPSLHSESYYNTKYGAGGGSGWSLTGNSGITPVTNFLGTTDAKGLRFKTNGIERINIDSINGFTEFKSDSTYQTKFVRTGTYAETGKLSIGNLGGLVGTQDPSFNVAITRTTGTLQLYRNLYWDASGTPDWAIEKTGGGDMIEIGQQGISFWNGAGPTVGTKNVRQHLALFTTGGAIYNSPVPAVYARNPNAVLFDFQVDSVSKATISAIGKLTLKSNADIQGGNIFFNTGSIITGSVNSNVTFTNFTQNDFGLLQLGGTTASFPGIKRIGTGIGIRNATDGAYTQLTAGNLDAEGGNLLFGLKSVITSTGTDGNISLTNNAQTDFGLLQLGGTTSSFPAIKRNGTGIDIRFANDAGYAPLQASTISGTTFLGGTFAGTTGTFTGAVSGTTGTFTGAITGKGLDISASTITLGADAGATTRTNSTDKTVKVYMPTRAVAANPAMMIYGGSDATQNWTYFGGGSSSAYASTDIIFWTAANNTTLTGTNRMAITSAGGIVFPATNTAGGTTGAQTINKPSGTVNIAAAGVSVVVTNSLITTTSLVRAFVRTNDANKTYVYAAVPAAGSVTIYVTPAPAAEISIGFEVIN